MPNRYLLLLSFPLPLSLTSSSAQNSKWALTYTPSLVETSIIRYGLQLGIAHDLNEKWQLLAEGTVALGQVDGNNSTNTRYLRFKPEIRHFLVNANRPFRTYIGLQMAYVNRAWINPSSGSFKEGSFSADSIINYSSASIHSPFLAVTTQVGGELKLRHRISLDGFIGIGAKSVFTSYSAITNPAKAVAVPVKCRIMFRPDPAWGVNGTLTRFQFNTGIRFLYRP